MKPSDKHEDRFFCNLGEYQKLYPSLIPRLKKAAAAGDPYVRKAIRITAEAARKSEAQQAERWQAAFKLTRTQAQIALYLASGRTVAAYAEEMNCSVETVRSHLKAIFAKTGVKRQAELAALAHRIG